MVFKKIRDEQVKESDYISILDNNKISVEIDYSNKLHISELRDSINSMD
ncbi:hypothetical protein [Candidatus Kinetoplastidibacterium desouzai]|nr:hypothetical protein [Candidatus Kinetoplastibacterium desouzaii]